jgi:hypothetical protein
MPFVPLVSRKDLYVRFMLLFMLLFILIVVFLGIIEFPLRIKDLLTITGTSFLSVPTSIIHGFASIVYDMVQWIYQSIENLVVKPVESVGSTIYNGVAGGLGSVGL